MNTMHELLMSYGEFIKDIEYEQEDGYYRIRIISYNNNLYYDHMHNGNVIECVKLTSEEE